MKPGRSLKSRALQLLAQRDQSRLELRQKLLRRLRRESGEDGAPEFDADRAEAEVEALLCWLDEHGFVSDDRFVESRVHARSPRFGNLRIRSELARHGVAVPVDVLGALVESELARAAAVRERRFPAPPASPAERAAQMRFLAGRGFTPEVIHRLLRCLPA